MKTIRSVDPCPLSRSGAGYSPCCRGWSCWTTRTGTGTRPAATRTKTRTSRSTGPTTLGTPRKVQTLLFSIFFLTFIPPLFPFIPPLFPNLFPFIPTLFLFIPTLFPFIPTLFLFIPTLFLFIPPLFPPLFSFFPPLFPCLPPPFTHTFYRLIFLVFLPWNANFPPKGKGLVINNLFV